jgi:hypothetical protein
MGNIEKVLAASLHSKYNRARLIGSDKSSGKTFVRLAKKNAAI